LVPGADPFTDGIILKCVAVVSSVAGIFLVRYVDRRHLFMTAIGTACICMFVCAISYTVSQSATSGKVIIGFVMIFEASYSFGIGPVSWAAASEMPSQRLRSTTMSIAMGVNFLLSWLVTFTLPYFFNPQHLGWGAKIGWLFGPANAIVFVWILFFLPETRNRPLEDIDEMFANKVPTWKFKRYEVVGLANAQEVQEKLYEHKAGVGVETVESTAP